MLVVERVSHSYEQVASLRDVSLRVERGEILCLLGPSGCGKTTLLRIIAGLETDFQGKISFDGQDLRQVPVHERGFGLMFQDFALFPHMSVEDNVAYGLKRHRVAKSERQKQVQSMLQRVGLAGFNRRDVASLSGGQKQRVALARSLAPGPRFLMLDEPLGSLDALLRDRLAVELRQIIKADGLNAIYVTHDHQEAYAIADRIAVMSAGTIQQQDRPFDLYHHPRTEFVARFLGLRNIFHRDDNPLARRLAGQVDPALSPFDVFLIHPSGIHLHHQPKKASLELSGRLESLVFRGDHSEGIVILPNEMRLSLIARGIQTDMGAAVKVFIALDAIKPLTQL